MKMEEKDKYKEERMTEEKIALTDEVTKHIKKLLYPLKNEKDLQSILKSKLTKKEFKILQAWANKEKPSLLKERLKIDEDRYKELSLKIIKKLNQEKLKQEISIV